jgi:phage shock protein C
MSAFRLDRSNAKWLGVCAGLGNATGFDPTLVRIAVLLSLFILGPITLLAYLLTAWAAS